MLSYLLSVFLSFWANKSWLWRDWRLRVNCHMLWYEWVWLWQVTNALLQGSIAVDQPLMTFPRIVSVWRLLSCPQLSENKAKYLFNIIFAFEDPLTFYYCLCGCHWWEAPLMAIGRIPLRETETDRKFNSISAMNLSWECRRGSLE